MTWDFLCLSVRKKSHYLCDKKPQIPNTIIIIMIWGKRHTEPNFCTENELNDWGVSKSHKQIYYSVKVMVIYWFKFECMIWIHFSPLKKALIPIPKGDTHTCYIPTQELQPSEDPAYTVCKGRVLGGKGKLEPTSIQWDGLTNSCVINCARLSLQLVVAACHSPSSLLEREPSRNAFWDMPSHEGSV